MKEKIMAWLPFMFTYYTIISLVVCGYNLLAGIEYIRLGWFLELFGFLVVFIVLEQVIGQLNFKSESGFLAMEIGIAYVLFLVFGYCFHWITFTLQSLLIATVLFAVNTILGVSYMNCRYKLRVKEMNELLQKRNE